MLYLLYGEDTEKSRKKLRSLVGLMLTKKPDASLFKLDIDNFKEEKLEELLSGQGLFEQKYIVQMDTLFTEKEVGEIVLNKIEEIQNSENIFIAIENKISKPILRKIEKIATKVQEFPLERNSERQFATRKGNFSIGDFNIFDLATKFGNRDKKGLWVMYQKTKIRDIPTEEVSGILFWQIKVMFQVLNSKNAGEAGLKPFVFNKAKNYLENYSKKELEKISSDLVSIYHNARRSQMEFGLALERFILRI